MGKETFMRTSIHCGVVALSALVLSAQRNPALGAAPGEWQAAGLMTQARDLPSIALLKDGSVLVTGGTGGSGAAGKGPYFVALATAELFDPQTGSFVAV